MPGTTSPAGRADVHPAGRADVHLTGRIDVHQHLMPAELVEALRSRSTGPRMSGWTLHMPGEPPYTLDPADHDVQARAAAEASTEAGTKAGAEAALVSLSSPMGIEDLPPDDAAPLLQAWHEGAARLPQPFRAWAAVTRQETELGDLKERLDAGFAGLQVPATWLATPAALERLAPVLAVCEQADRPVLVHPGPVPARDAAGLPEWWPAVVDYPAQLAAAWFAWHVAGRSLLSRLRICFVAGAGLAPAQHERLAARGGSPGSVDPEVFVETSSYGPQAVDALIRALGIDVVVLGSDRPNAEAACLRDASFGLGEAAARAVESVNPHRYLTGGAR